ncbi:hypothetical protein ACNHUS_18940 [Actinomycetes bacterium M1A6_2h]
MPGALLGPAARKQWITYADVSEVFAATAGPTLADVFIADDR